MCQYNPIYSVCTAKLFMYSNYIPVAVYVKSNTIVGDAKHREGVVLAEIVKANIPVSNGVVHLIHRPLMIIDTTVTQFLQVCGVLGKRIQGNCSHTDTTQT